MLLLHERANFVHEYSELSIPSVNFRAFPLKRRSHVFMIEIALLNIHLLAHFQFQHFFFLFPRALV